MNQSRSPESHRPSPIKRAKHATKIVRTAAIAGVGIAGTLFVADKVLGEDIVRNTAISIDGKEHFVNCGEDEIEPRIGTVKLLGQLVSENTEITNYDDSLTDKQAKMVVIEAIKTLNGINISQETFPVQPVEIPESCQITPQAINE